MLKKYQKPLQDFVNKVEKKPIVFKSNKILKTNELGILTKSIYSVLNVSKINNLNIECDETNLEYYFFREGSIADGNCFYHSYVLQLLEKVDPFNEYIKNIDKYKLFNKDGKQKFVFKFRDNLKDNITNVIFDEIRLGLDISREELIRNIGDYNTWAEDYAAVLLNIY